MSSRTAGPGAAPGRIRRRRILAAALLGACLALAACADPAAPAASPVPAGSPSPAAADAELRTRDLVEPPTPAPAPAEPAPAPSSSSEPDEGSLSEETGQEQLPEDGVDPPAPAPAPAEPAPAPVAPSDPDDAAEPVPGGAEPPPEPPADPVPAMCSTEVPTPCEFSTRAIAVRSAGGRSSELSVEIADTPELRLRGLMFRSSLGDGEGMLFEFGGETSGGLWMRNTYVGLDIAFLDGGGVILAILHGEPESLETISPGQPYHYALEVNRGWFARTGFGVGDHVTVAGIPAPAPPLPTPTPTPIAGGPAAAALLNELDVLPEQDSGYDRSDWPHWSDLDGDGCNTRCEVLAAERRDDGSWYSVFDGRSTTTPREFDIDHLVPLAEAHESGGWQWDRTTRRNFANDEIYAHSLIAVSASSNRSKGKKDPGEWLPPDAGSHCFYADAWVRVKHRWSLSVDLAELIALGRILTDCPDVSAAPAAPARVATAAPTPTPVPVQDGGRAADVAIASCDARGELVVISGPAGTGLAGWTLSDEGDRNVHTFAPGTAIPASGSLVVASGRASGDVKPWGGRNVWNNDGDTATLQSPGGGRVSRACS